MAGRDLVKQAEAKLKGGILSAICRAPRNYDEAGELYLAAANQFKLSKEWPEAANCFIQCAYCANGAGSMSDEANYLTEAGNVLKRISTAQAVEQYEKAIVIYSNVGRYQQAGKLLMTIAELYEAEHLSHTEVKEYYKRSADMFDLDEHGKSSFSKCNLKVAEYAARDGDLEDAIRIFESEGEKALQNDLMRYHAKEHFFKAGILHMVVGDSTSVNIAVEKYNSLDPRFGDSREGELLQGLAETFENNDIDLFTEMLHAYDSVSRLDPWKTDFLCKVKESLGGASGNTVEAVDLT